MVKHVYVYTTEEDLDEKQETVSYSYDLSGNVVSVNFNGEDYYYLVFCQALFPEKSVEIPCFHQGIFPAFGGY